MEVARDAALLQHRHKSAIEGQKQSNPHKIGSVAGHGHRLCKLTHLQAKGIWDKARTYREQKEREKIVERQ